MTPTWLNGWPRVDDTVLIGTSYHCVGCGQYRSIGCVAFPEGHVWPDALPVWPFEEDTCPVHHKTALIEPEQISFDTWPPRAVALYKRLVEVERDLAAYKTIYG